MTTTRRRVALRKSSAMAQSHLRKVKKAAEEVEKAEGRLRAAILAAQASGETYRDIADFA
jgi:hypothetical protein